MNNITKAQAAVEITALCLGCLSSVVQGSAKGVGL